MLCYQRATSRREFFSRCWRQRQAPGLLIQTTETDSKADEWRFFLSTAVGQDRFVYWDWNVIYLKRLKASNVNKCNQFTFLTSVCLNLELQIKPRGGLITQYELWSLYSVNISYWFYSVSKHSHDRSVIHVRVPELYAKILHWLLYKNIDSVNNAFHCHIRRFKDVIMPRITGFLDFFHRPVL
jgi:hypothetical protein